MIYNAWEEEMRTKKGKKKRGGGGGGNSTLGQPVTRSHIVHSSSGSNPEDGSAPDDDESSSHGPPRRVNFHLALRMPVMMKIMMLASAPYVNVTNLKALQRSFGLTFVWGEWIHNVCAFGNNNVTHQYVKTIETSFSPHLSVKIFLYFSFSYFVHVFPFISVFE